MDLNAFNARNAAALRAFSGGYGGEATPYFGYYQVDIFECPPFLMFTNNDCPRARNILITGSFEPQSMRVWCRLARTATGIVDIGAHVGVYSLAAAALRSDISIHAFEPNPPAFSRLQMHKWVNAFDNIVEHALAVGDNNDYVHFTWSKKPGAFIPSGGHIGLSESPNVEHAVVPRNKLDGIGLARTLGDRPLVKIDAEGHEAQVLGGMQELLALRPDIILETFDKDPCKIINEMVAPLGYRIFLIREMEGVLEERQKLLPCDQTGSNYNQLLTVRSDKEVANLNR